MKTIDGYVCQAEDGFLFGPYEGRVAGFQGNSLQCYSTKDEAERGKAALQDRYTSTVKKLRIIIAETIEEARQLSPPYIVMQFSTDRNDPYVELYGRKVSGRPGHDSYAYLRDNGHTPFVDLESAISKREDIQRQGRAPTALAHWELK